MKSKLSWKKIIIFALAMCWIIAISIIAPQSSLFDIMSRAFCTVVFFVRGVNYAYFWVKYKRREEDKILAVMFFLFTLGYGMFFFSANNYLLGNIASAFDWMVGLYLVYEFKDKSPRFKDLIRGHK